MDKNSTSVSPLERAIIARRAALAKQGLQAQNGRWGIALSGGGIRSAVFSYGLVTALAKSGVLWRFDLLSTVSGGGYFGSALGKLACSRNAHAIQDELSKPRDQSPFQQQMRASNRYLNPKGNLDFFYVAAIYLRNILAVHVEFFVICVLISSSISLWDLLIWKIWECIPPLPTLTLNGGWPGVFYQLQSAVSQMIILSPLLLLTLPCALYAIYWCGYYWYAPLDKNPNVTLLINERLKNCLACFMLVLLLATIDMIAQRLSSLEYWLLTLGGFYSGLLVLMRLLIPLLQLKRDASSLVERKLFMLLDFAGLFGLFVLVIFWLSVFHILLTHQLWSNDNVVYLRPSIMVLVVAIFVGILFACKMNNWLFLNRSSLHQFYRLRLGLAWLGFDKTPQKSSPRRETDIDPVGDIRFSDYRPWQHGGPVHLLNVCLNETTRWKDATTRDRQGHMMSLLGGGYFSRDSQRDWLKITPCRSLSLASWMAISGAAVAPGMGILTRPGLAALFTSLGVRLGFWWQSDDEKMSRNALKYRCLYSELMGSFSLENGKPWFLSDGGHAENTAAWELLKAHCELIILSDAASDPDYDFNDLANLMRRARTDLGITIEFVMPINNMDGLFGSLDDLGDPQSISCLALARIHYPDSRSGLMILVKPNLTTNLPDDVFNYARDNPTFPQQGTVDQFYDEAQWESYFALGQRLGRPLTFKRLQKLLALEGTELQPASCSLLPIQSNKPLLSRRPTRITRKAGAAASLGLAAVITSASGLYAALQQVAAPYTGFDLNKIYQQFADLNRNDVQQFNFEATNKMAALILMAKNSSSDLQFQQLREKEPQFQRLIENTFESCKQYPSVITCQLLCHSSIKKTIAIEISPMVNAKQYWMKYNKMSKW